MVLVIGTVFKKLRKRKEKPSIRTQLSYFFARIAKKKQRQRFPYKTDYLKKTILDTVILSLISLCAFVRNKNVQIINHKCK